ncbi:MAG: hypothetical protein L0H10_06770 [Comamonas sp.]|uniref:hypothetical protein n=1 Tax=Comamonas TaxID=283 RepID=UPI00076BCD9B|nr:MULTISPECIES: hypothetical protein [Comamonas]KWT66474.1 hypothetical protein APV28_4360 [Comamonas testosteroni]MDN5503508.1 hypothetical protein [Comamonas sp.]MDN5536333.1 hypothetical protein [Comamonas sp.]
MNSTDKNNSKIPSNSLLHQSAKRIHSIPSLVSPARKSAGLFYSPPPIQRACLSPQGDSMLYSTVPQPVDEDLVQRLREKGGL